MRGAAQLLRRRGTAPLMLLKSAAAVDRGSLRRGSTIVGDRSTRASSTQAVSMLPAEQWKVVYRAFLLHVHPDFFHHQPEQRAINERNLKTFQQHLQQLEHTRGQTAAAAAAAAYQQQRGRGALASGSARLVFFLKPGMAHKDPPSTIHDDDADNGHSNNSSSSSSSSSSNGNSRKISNSNIGNQSNKSSGLARKLILPLESHRTMATLLHEAGITSTHIPPPPGRAQPPTATGSHSSNQKDDGSEWEDWTEDLFGRASASRARDEAESRDRRSRRYAASDNVEGAFGEGRQKTTEWGAASEEFEYRGHDASRLGYVLATDAGKTMVRERRSSALNVRELVGQLQGQYGFGDFTFRQAYRIVIMMPSCLCRRESRRTIVVDMRIYPGMYTICPRCVPGIRHFLCDLHYSRLVLYQVLINSCCSTRSVLHHIIVAVWSCSSTNSVTRTSSSTTPVLLLLFTIAYDGQSDQSFINLPFIAYVLPCVYFRYTYRYQYMYQYMRA